MATTVVPSARGPKVGGDPLGRGRIGVVRRRHRMRMLAGAGVMVVCAAGFWVTAFASSDQASVVTLARPVSYGQVLAAGDLRVVTIGSHLEVPVVPASQRADLVGRVVGSALPAGSLLSEGVLVSAVPGPGQALVSVSVKAGKVPPMVNPGAQVVVSETKVSGSGPASGAEAGVRGTVLDVRPGAGGAAVTAVTVLCDQGQAARVAQLQEPAVIVLPAQAPGPGR
ncbi:SAF domain-containing protein [Kitasatospora sp. NPDC001175]|uniref:SAF domain-containing protein n=1 Tax=Kitasatospora sp. NPDC001175 TaxID=3157103 RepID=UPI003D0514B7